MDVVCKKEQIGTLFVWVGALEGGFGGWMVPQGCPSQKVYVPSKKRIHTPACPPRKIKTSWLGQSYLIFRPPSLPWYARYLMVDTH